MPHSRLKVLFLVESLSGGGAEKILSGLVRGLDRDKFDVTVCAVVDCGQYRDEVRKPMPATASSWAALAGFIG